MKMNCNGLLLQVFCAISGKDGTEIWTFEKGPAKNPIMNIYTSQFIRDLNNDGVVDILAVHGGDPLAEPGELIIIFQFFNNQKDLKKY